MKEKDRLFKGAMAAIDWYLLLNFQYCFINFSIKLSYYPQDNT